MLCETLISYGISLLRWIFTDCLQDTEWSRVDSFCWILVRKLCFRIKGRVGTFSRITSWLFEIFDSFLCSFVDLRSGFLSSITLWGPPTILDWFPEANASCSKNHNSYSSSKLNWAPERKTFKAPFSGHARAIHFKLSRTTHSMPELGVKNKFARVSTTLHYENWREIQHFSMKLESAHFDRFTKVNKAGSRIRCSDQLGVQKIHEVWLK